MTAVVTENTNACLTNNEQCWPYLSAKQNLT